jgi:hypothetical protein
MKALWGNSGLFCILDYSGFVTGNIGWGNQSEVNSKKGSLPGGFFDWNLYQEQLPGSLECIWSWS